ncbi:WAT1-related protein At5g40240 [Linum grandiflorum]
MAGVGVTAVMVALEVVEVGVSTILKAAMDDGVVNQFVFIVYSNLLALPFISASCFLLYRCFLQILLIVGVKYSSPTMNSAMLDLTPAYTFLLALLSRMEKLEYKSRSSQAKLIGTLVSIAGALMITLYKGQPIQTMKLHYYNSSQTDQTLELEMTNWVIGGILCAAGSLCLAFGYIVMVRDQ